jgi:flagellar biosynthesis regulator FlaF
MNREAREAIERSIRLLDEQYEVQSEKETSLREAIAYNRRERDALSELLRMGDTKGPDTAIEGGQEA